tara:strand:+ start:402 stop:1043 length:642 start_codon:yes stop_codon:yes gene_type:complete
MNFTDYGLDEEVANKLKADYEADVLGLKNKNNELIDREKAAKDSVESMTLQIATAEENNKVAIAEKENDVAKYKLAIDERDDKLKAVQFEFAETNNKRLLESAVNDFSGSLTDDPAGRMFMQSQFNNSVEVKDGVVVPKDITTNLKDLTHALVTDEANASYIKANVGRGAGSAGSDGFSKANTGSIAGLSSAKAQQINSAVSANPKLKNLPIR